MDSEDGYVSDVELFSKPKLKARRKERVQFRPSELKMIIQNINHRSSNSKYYTKYV